MLCMLQICYEIQVKMALALTLWNAPSLDWLRVAAIVSSFYRWNVQNFRMWKIQLISAKTTIILIPHEELEHKGEKLRHMKAGG